MILPEDRPATAILNSTAPHRMSSTIRRSSPSPPTTSPNMMQPYLPLLNCPICSPPALLDAPTTLHCGHTVCSVHVRKHPAPASSSSSPAPQAHLPTSSQTQRISRHPQPSPATIVPVLPSCPLPTCRHTSTPRARVSNIPNIPHDSPVAYYPPIAPPASVLHQPTAEQIITVVNPRIDVTISRILTLTRRTDFLHSQGESEFVPTPGDQSDNETDDEDSVQEDGDDEQEQDREQVRTGLPSESPDSAAQIYSPNPAERRLHSHRDSPPRRHSRPHKRQRRQDPTAPPQPHLPIGREERFNKELLDHLTCEICFMLLFQPVTTPCQHVRIKLVSVLI